MDAADGSPEPAPGRRRTARVAMVAIALLVLAAISLGSIWLVRHVQLLPGVRGCTVLSELDAREDCYGELARAELRNGTPDMAFTRLEKQLRSHGQARSECHKAMHPVGERDGARAARDGRPPRMPTSEGNCVSGYLHGLLQGYLPNAGDDIDLKTLANRACGQRDVANYTSENCIHGLGHGLMAGDDPEVESALDSCRSLGAERAGDCAGGVFMSHAEQEPDVERLVETCLRASAQFRPACFKYVAFGARTAGMSDRKAMQLCGRAEHGSPEHLLCIQDVGIGLGEANAGRCSTLAADNSVEQVACWRGALYFVASWTTALTTCDTARGTVQRAACIQEAAVKLREGYPDDARIPRAADRVARCEQLASRDRAACARGVKLTLANALADNT